MANHEFENKTREIKEQYCTEPKCQFYGASRVQGVCYETEGEVADWAKMDKLEQELVTSLKDLRVNQGRGYVKALEAHYISAMMNWTLGLDDLVRLRRERALYLSKAKKKVRR